jgi:hypothetical protein
MRAELMAKLEGDFKLSPEEDDSSSSDTDSDPEGKGQSPYLYTFNEPMNRFRVDNSYGQCSLADWYDKEGVVRYRPARIGIDFWAP